MMGTMWHLDTILIDTKNHLLRFSLLVHLIRASIIAVHLVIKKIYACTDHDGSYVKKHISFVMKISRLCELDV